MPKNSACNSTSILELTFAIHKVLSLIKFKPVFSKPYSSVRLVKLDYIIKEYL